MLGVGLLAVSCSGQASKITLSRNKVLDRGVVVLTGTAFPPKVIVYSHLKRPDGTEFPALRFLTNEKGEFTHKIETFTLQEGTHEAWVLDGGGHSSNVEKFEVKDDTSQD